MFFYLQIILQVSAHTLPHPRSLLGTDITLSLPIPTPLFICNGCENTELHLTFQILESQIHTALSILCSQGLLIKDLDCLPEDTVQILLSLITQEPRIITAILLH